MSLCSFFLFQIFCYEFSLNLNYFLNVLQGGPSIGTFLKMRSNEHTLIFFINFFFNQFLKIGKRTNRWPTLYMDSLILNLYLDFVACLIVRCYIDDGNLVRQLFVSTLVSMSLLSVPYYVHSIWIFKSKSANYFQM